MPRDDSDDVPAYSGKTGAKPGVAKIAVRFLNFLHTAVPASRHGAAAALPERPEGAIVTPCHPEIWGECETGPHYRARRLGGGVGMEFSGKVALITGGGGGIGRATALGFAGAVPR